MAALNDGQGGYIESGNDSKGMDATTDEQTSYGQNTSKLAKKRPCGLNNNTFSIWLQSTNVDRQMVYWCLAEKKAIDWYRFVNTHSQGNLYKANRFEWNRKN